MRQKIAIAEARRRLKDVLNDLGPEGASIERHGKPVALLIRPDQHLVPKSQWERREARLKQAGIEDQRLIRHLRIGNRLLSSSPQEAQAMVDRALDRVSQWEREQLCSRDYIQRWRAMLARPQAELVDAMCGDAEGWGPALRQNSPW